jgi:hypothetical protein
VSLPLNVKLRLNQRDFVAILVVVAIDPSWYCCCVQSCEPLQVSYDDLECA